MKPEDLNAEEQDLYDRFYRENVERDMPDAESFIDGEAGVRATAAENAAWKIEYRRNPPSLVGTVVNLGG